MRKSMRTMWGIVRYDTTGRTVPIETFVDSTRKRVFDHIRREWGMTPRQLREGTDYRVERVTVVAE